MAYIPPITPVAARLVRQHRLLRQEMVRLVDELHGQRSSAPVDGILLAQMRQAMADVARLMSREKGGRAFKRLPPGAALSAMVVDDCLFDGRRALDAFERAHAFGTGNSEEEPLWLTIEELAAARA